MKKLQISRPQVDWDRIRHGVVTALLVVALILLFSLAVSTDHMIWFVWGLAAVLGFYLLITARNFAREHTALAVLIFLVGVGGFILSRVTAPHTEPSVTVTEVVVITTPLSSGEMWGLITFFVVFQVGTSALLGFVGARFGSLVKFSVVGPLAAALWLVSVWFFEQPALSRLFTTGVGLGIVPGLLIVLKILFPSGRVFKVFLDFLAQLVSPVVLWGVLASNQVDKVLFENPMMDSQAAHWAVILGLLVATLAIKALQAGFEALTEDL